MLEITMQTTWYRYVLTMNGCTKNTIKRLQITQTNTKPHLLVFQHNKDLLPSLNLKTNIHFAKDKLHLLFFYDHWNPLPLSNPKKKGTNFNPTSNSKTKTPPKCKSLPKKKTFPFIWNWQLNAKLFKRKTNVRGHVPYGGRVQQINTYLNMWSNN
jgi:hypothetical protein